MPKRSPGPTDHSFSNKRTEKQQEADLVLTEQLIVQGCNMREIAEAISSQRPYSICWQQVQKDCKKLDARWKIEQIQTRDEMKRAEKVTLTALYRQVYLALVESKKDFVKKVIEVIRSENKKKPGRPSKQRVETYGQYGDPRLMALLIQIRGMIIKLYGLDEPTVLELSGPDGEPIKIQTDALLEKVYGDPRFAIPKLDDASRSGAN